MMTIKKTLDNTCFLTWDLKREVESISSFSYNDFVTEIPEIPARTTWVLKVTMDLKFAEGINELPYRVPIELLVRNEKLKVRLKCSDYYFSNYNLSSLGIVEAEIVLVDPNFEEIKPKPKSFFRMIRPEWQD